MSETASFFIILERIISRNDLNKSFLSKEFINIILLLNRQNSTS